MYSTNESTSVAIFLGSENNNYTENYNNWKKFYNLTTEYKNCTMLVHNYKAVCKESIVQ